MKEYKEKLFAASAKYWQKFRGALVEITPGKNAWLGAAFGAFTAAFLFWLLLMIQVALPHSIIHSLIGLAGGLLIALIFGAVLILIISILRRIPLLYLLAFSAAFLLLAIVFLAMPLIPGTIAIALLTIVTGSLCGAAAAVVKKGSLKNYGKPQKVLFYFSLILGLALLNGGAAFLILEGFSEDKPFNAGQLSAENVVQLDLPDPSGEGYFNVKYLTYGSGDDLRRAEFSEGADLVTPTVDGSKLVSGWTALRTAYWGFEPENLPLNGRVWYPEGEGPFPLVLIVHGNHLMEDYSDEGYAYLAEMLASRGFITVSIDQNFLNLSLVADLGLLSGLKNENDLRAWLLLEHLAAWKNWNEQDNSPFYQDVDLDSIALVGHSRGGEAVAIAAAFNNLSFHPDNAELVFDYNFGIKSVVSIAPVDGQYLPGNKRLPLSNINYLVIHGSHDMDVISFHGARQYARIEFDNEPEVASENSPDNPENSEENISYFKSAIYIYGANHGQFNSDWGRKDITGPAIQLFNLRNIMPAEEQQQAAKVVLGAFLEATLNEIYDYRLLFQDFRRGAHWLPEQIYIGKYYDSNTVAIANYDEDIDLGTTTLPDGKIEGENLARWREQDVPLKWGSLEDRAAYLSWDRNSATGTPLYRVILPEMESVLTAESVIVFDLAETDMEDNNGDTGDALNDDQESVEEIKKPIDLTIELVDTSGNRAALPLSHFSLLQPQLKAKLGKADFMNSLALGEPVYQTFEFAISDFLDVNTELDYESLKEINLIFDRTSSGAVFLDRLGIRP